MARNLFETQQQSSGRNLFQQQVAEPQSSVMDRGAQAGDLLAPADIALTAGSRLLAEPISGLAGIAGSILPGKDGQGADWVESTRQALSYNPRTEIGKNVASGAAELLAPVGEAVKATEDFLGENTLNLTGSPLAATVAATAPTALMELAGLKIGRASKLTAKADDVAPSDLSFARKGAQYQSPYGSERQTPKARADRFDDTGVTATRGEIEKDFDQLKQENMLLEQSSEAGDNMRQLKLNQSREIEKYISDISPESSGNVGESIKNAIELRKSSAKYKRAQAYDKLAEATKDTDVKLNTDVLSDGLPDAGELRDFSVTFKPQSDAINGLLTEFGVSNNAKSIKAMSDQGIEVAPLSVSNAERFRKRLNAIEASDPTGNTSRFTGPIKQALDSEFDIASKALEKNGNQSVAAAAKEARQSHMAYKGEFDEKGIVDQLIASKSRGSKIPKLEESQVYNKIVSPSVPVEQVQSLVKSLNRAGSRGRAAINDMKAQMIMDLIDSGFQAGSRKVKGERLFGATAFSKRFDKLQPKLEAVFSPAELDKLKKARMNAEDLIPPSGAVPKGSAGFFIDSLNQLGLFTLLHKIPVVGGVISDQVQTMSRAAQNRKIYDRAVSRPKTKDVLDFTLTNYPSMAAGLGLQAVKEESEQTDNNKAQ